MVCIYFFDRSIAKPEKKHIKKTKKARSLQRRHKKKKKSLSTAPVDESAIAHSPTGKVEKEAAPGFTLAGFLRWFSWWHFKPTKIIAGDVHLRCHLDRKIGNFLLQLLVPSDSAVPAAKPVKKITTTTTDHRELEKKKEEPNAPRT